MKVLSKIKDLSCAYFQTLIRNAWNFSFAYSKMLLIWSSNLKCLWMYKPNNLTKSSLLRKASFKWIKYSDSYCLLLISASNKWHLPWLHCISLSLDQLRTEWLSDKRLLNREMMAFLFFSFFFFIFIKRNTTNIFKHFLELKRFKGW